MSLGAAAIRWGMNVGATDPCAGAPSSVTCTDAVAQDGNRCSGGSPGEKYLKYSVTVDVGTALTSAYEIRVFTSWRTSSGAPSYTWSHTLTSIETFPETTSVEMTFYRRIAGSETWYFQAKAEVVPAGETSPVCRSDESSERTETQVLTC